ncbi:MAG: hypothetical protein ACRBBJ_08885 [Rhodomicrobiaceae bacterium]
MSVFEKEKIAIEHARSWFQIHAEHRLRLVNFYIVLVVASLAFAASALKDGQTIAMSMLGALIIIVSFVFQNLDRRVASLIKDAEKALTVLEKKISSDLEITDLNLVKLADDKRGAYSYRQLFNILYYSGYALGTCIFLYTMLFRIPGIHQSFIKCWLG